MIDEKKLVALFGEGSVSYDPTLLRAFSSDQSLAHAVRPACVVKPRDCQSIQELVKLAGETATPLVPVSSGPPHFRGDTIPGIGGAIVVDLSGMKKIIRVDRAHRVAMVEPGVTFGELIPAVKAEGLRLNLPLAPRQTKSVVGSLLEREPPTMPRYHWDISDPLACLEIVFGNGEVFRTGQAAGPGNLEEQWAAGAAQKTPYGPGPAAWYRLVQGAQGTMGIVTWASLRCELLPALEEPFLVGSSDLAKLCDMAHWLVRMRLVNQCLLLNGAALAAVTARDWPQDFAVARKELPPWILFYVVAGYSYFPGERVSSQIAGIANIAQRLGLEPCQGLGGKSAAEIQKIVQAPSPDPYWKLRMKGACQDLFFITTYDLLDAQIKAIYDLAAGAAYPAADLGFYLQPIVQGTNLHCEFNLFYHPSDAEEVERIKLFSRSAIQSLLATGAFFSRPYGENAREIMDRNASTAAALGKIKGILDPGHIMNPGKLCF